MSDTSLVFNIIARDSGVGRALAAVQRAFKGAGDQARTSLNEAGQSTENLDRMISEATGRVRSLSAEFERTGDKKLFGQISRDRSLISNLEKIRGSLRDTGGDSDRLGGNMSSLASRFMSTVSAVQGFGSSISSAAGSVQGAMGPWVQLGFVIAGVSAAAFAAPAALYAVGGAAAALPGMLSGAIAALFTLKMGLSGLGANWAAMNAPATGGGGGGGGGAPKVDMTPKIRAVEAAQRGVAKSARDVADAQADLREATDDVNDARAEEKERIEDVRRSLASARADEEESVQSLAEARMQLALAEQRGNPDEIRRAQIAVDKQAASLEEAKDKTQDLKKESDEAARKGVEGSDAVVEAKKREKEAQRRVQDAVMAHKLAIQQLADAQKSLNEKIAAAGAAAGGGMGVVLPKIAKSAQEFLNELKRLKPAFDELRLDIQQRLFEGLAGKLRILAERWLPALHTGLGAMADMMNGVVKHAFDSLSEPEFIKNTMIGVAAVRDALGKVGHAIAGPLVDAWGRLSAASAPFIRMLGDKLAGIIDRFSAWIKSADESGALTAFFEKATSITGSLFDIFTNLASITGSFISILFGTQGGSTDAWENLADASEKIAKWMANPSNQAKISKYLDMFGGAVFGMGRLAASLDDIWRTGERFVAWVKNAYNTVKDFFTNLPETIRTTIDDIGRWFSELPGRIGDWLSRLPGVIGAWLSQAAYQMGYWIGYGIGWMIRQLVALPGNIWGILRRIPGLALSMVNSFLGFLYQLPGLAWRAMVNTGNNIVRAISWVAGAMWSVGYSIVTGIWNGITSMANWLWSACYNFALGIWRGVKSALGIGSPSKLMAGLGREIPAGLAMGMDQNAGAVTDSITRISRQLAGTTMTLPGVDSAALSGQLTASANSLVTVQAAKRTQKVQVDLNVIGSDGMIKTALQKLNRTSNLKLV